MNRRRLCIAVRVVVCLAAVSSAEGAGPAAASPRDERQVILEACALEQAYLVRVERLERAWHEAARDKETDRLERIGDTLDRLDDWRDGRIRSMRDSLGSAAAKVELDWALSRVTAGDAPFAPAAEELEPAEEGDALAADELADPAAASLETAEGAEPATADALDLRENLRQTPLRRSRDPMDGPTPAVGPVRVSVPASGADVIAAVVREPAAVGVEPVAGNGQTAKSAPVRSKRVGPPTVRRTARGISITVPNQSGRMNNAVHGWRGDRTGAAWAGRR